MDQVEIMKLVENEEAVGEAGDKEIGTCVVCCTGQLCIALHEEMLLSYAPTLNVVLLNLITISNCPALVPPLKECPVFAHGIYNFLIVGEPCRFDNLSMTSQNGWHKSINGRQAPYSSSKIF